jgi:hypothetical protein
MPLMENADPVRLELNPHPELNRARAGGRGDYAKAARIGQ